MVYLQSKSFGDRGHLHGRDQPLVRELRGMYRVYIPVARKHRNVSGVQLGEDVVRAMILRGAAKVLAARGVRATGIEDVLEASRVSRRTFYRMYGRKEDVMLALYRIGTERLLQACRTALDEENDPLRQAQLCIDAHLQTARDQSRLMFVLGGDAHHQESALYARRIEVHEALASMMAARAKASMPRPPDKLVFRALLFALEGVTRLVLAEGDDGRHVTPESLERARAVMLRVATATLAGDGEGVAPLPAYDAASADTKARRSAAR
jgi:AcrR family transcriptional regulator